MLLRRMHTGHEVWRFDDFSQIKQLTSSKVTIENMTLPNARLMLTSNRMRFRENTQHRKKIYHVFSPTTFWNACFGMRFFDMQRDESHPIFDACILFLAQNRDLNAVLLPTMAPRVSTRRCLEKSHPRYLPILLVRRQQD